MSKVRITQVKSTIKRTKVQKDTIAALGLGRINRSVELEYTDQIKGMVRTVNHLVNVIEL